MNEVDVWHRHVPDLLLSVLQHPLHRTIYPSRTGIVQRDGTSQTISRRSRMMNLLFHLGPLLRLTFLPQWHALLPFFFFLKDVNTLTAA
ncbi:hypothetical protein BDR04DRAFT_132194 [Suillus decipiens]|nr:hypothetical protein BDR04DRAFT_132194 [Suillus decipiens]